MGLGDVGEDRGLPGKEVAQEEFSRDGVSEWVC